MAESVLTLCPNCGRRLNVAPYQEMVTCSSCKQVSKIQYPWGVHQPKPEPPRQMVMQPVLPEKRGSDNRVLWLVLILGLVLATAGAVTFGVILSRMRAAEPPPPPPGRDRLDGELAVRDLRPAAALLQHALAVPRGPRGGVRGHRRRRHRPLPHPGDHFAKGYDLDQQLGALWGEGGGGDAPESYGLFAHWLLTHVEVPNAADTPFLIVFGDAPMHEKVPGSQIQKWLGDHTKDVDAVKAWQQLGQKWNTWFLRRPTGRKGDEVHVQWAKAVGEKKILTIDDEQRAVDYAMGIVARAWGNFEDFKSNMRARQPEDKVEKLSAPIAMICPRCGGPIPDAARGLFKCGYCGTPLKI